MLKVSKEQKLTISITYFFYIYKAALEDIIARNLTEIRKYGFGDISVKDNKFEWTPIQFWTILKLLNEQPSVRKRK